MGKLKTLSNSRIETLKWISTFFILVNMAIAAVGLVPYNFIALSIGTFIWFLVGYIVNDRPLMVINSVGCVLSTISYFTN